jgi:hypothetical protein
MPTQAFGNVIAQIVCHLDKVASASQFVRERTSSGKIWASESCPESGSLAPTTRCFATGVCEVWPVRFENGLKSLYGLRLRLFHIPWHKRFEKSSPLSGAVMSWKTKLAMALHDYVLAKIEQRAHEATGGHVQIQNFALHLFTLTGDACGITLRGTEPQSSPPLVRADQLMVRLKIVSLLRRKVDLNQIILRHPVVNLLVGKDGTTNLPSPPRKNTGSSARVFDRGLQHLLLTNGEIYCHDVKTPMDVELHDLQLEVKSEPASNRYDGTLSYRDGQVQYCNAKPLPHDLHASFNASPSEFTLKPLVLTIASSIIQLEGNVQNYSSPILDGTYKITIHTQDSQSVRKSPSVPRGTITLAGSLRYQPPKSAGGEFRDSKPDQSWLVRDFKKEIPA